MRRKEKLIAAEHRLNENNGQPEAKKFKNDYCTDSDASEATGQDKWDELFAKLVIMD